MPAVASQPVADFLAHANIRGVVEDGEGKWKCYCPLHEADGGSHDPSLHITDDPQKGCLLHCFVCGEEKKVQIVHAAHWTMAKLFPQQDKSSKKGKNGRPKGSKRIAEYIYRNEFGAVAYRAERFEPKDFRQSQPNGNGGWTYNMRGVTKVPYRLPELIAAPKPSTVFIVEGEKKVEALMAWGLVATCNVGGAGKWHKDYSKYLKNHDVVILPDNDPVKEDGTRTGEEHARKVIACSKDVVKSIRIVTLPGLPPKGDIVDWIDAGGTLPKLMELISQPGTGTELATIPAATVEKTEITEMDPLDLRVKDSRCDKGNGQRFTKLHEGTLKYCFPWKKWLFWDGNRWSVDQKGAAVRNAKAVVDELWEEFREISRDISDESLKQILSFAQFSGSERSISHMIELAKSEDGNQFMPSELDANPWLLNCPNGTIDLMNGTLKPHDKADLITQISPIPFDPDKTCPVWEQFLLKVFSTQDMVDYVQRLCGCWITGVVRDESLPILWGVGSNGKTTFVNVVLDILGPDYSMKAISDFLMIKKFQGHPTEKADLFRKRFVLCSETDETGRLDEAMVKDLTGREKIRARRMREDNWEFDPTHKIALMTNHMPQIRGTDHGIWRRIRKIEFGKQFWNPDIGETGPAELMRDNTLADRIKDEYSGILTWMVKGAIRWHQDGEQAPSSVSSWTKEYRVSQDVLQAFIDECCTEASSDSVTPGDLYARFAKWAKQSNEFIVKKTKFGIMMRERGYERDHSQKWYLGIGLRDESDF